MNVLVIGGGGREHALAWKLAQSEKVSKVFVAPGNAGTATEPKLENVDIAVEAISELVTFAKANQIELTVVGPEVPLVLGVVDAFKEEGLTIFGPSKAAAQLEGSKAFAKDFLKRHNIPTAEYENFTDIAAAKAYLDGKSYPIVIKADGLAAGKGVIIAEDRAHAEATIDDMLEGNKFGDAGARVVIEEFLVGEEASFIVMVDGKNILPMATSQDHKARDNGDKGPNTGGMGAYSPAPVVTNEIHDWVMEKVIRPTVDGMASEGNVFTGFLYAGLMIGANGKAKVLEFNCRFGDPETQPIMMRIKSDFSELCLKAAKGELAGVTCEYDPRVAMGVVLAAGGYPDAYNKGDVISGLEINFGDSAKVFQAGTSTNANGEIVTNGGRVVCATALGNTIAEAQTAAYEVVKQVNWKDVYYRTDIGHKAI